MFITFNYKSTLLCVCQLVTKEAQYFCIFEVDNETNMRSIADICDNPNDIDISDPKITRYLYFKHYYMSNVHVPERTRNV